MDWLPSSWKNSPESNTLTVDFSSQDNPSMSWQSSALDGMGTLSGEEQALLDNLDDSKLAHGLAMIPLDVACEGDDSPDPAQMAALLYPLQMRFKYQVTDRAAEASELLALSQCNYGNADKETGKSSSIIMMTPSNPVPVVLGYFPFDEVGAVEISTTQGGARSACMQVGYLAGINQRSAKFPPVVWPLFLWRRSNRK